MATSSKYHYEGGGDPIATCVASMDIVAAAATTADVVPPELQHLVDPLQSGFVWYQPPPASMNNEQWNIAGTDMQVLTVTLEPNETMVTEVGSFLMGSHGVDMDVECTCRTQEGCQRICGGESCVKLLLTNQSPNKGYVGLTPKFPAKIIPLQFGHHIHHPLIAQAGTYMAHISSGSSSSKPIVSCDLDCSCATCCCAGFGCCRQTITAATNDIVFMAAGGTVVVRQLEPLERITVDTRSVVAMEETVRLGIVPNGRFCMCCCGGEGCYSTTLTGPGKVFLQSMTFQKFKDAVQGEQTIVSLDPPYTNKRH